MSALRNELKKSNPYYISKYRRLEAKYFALQYEEMSQEYNDISLQMRAANTTNTRVDGGEVDDDTSYRADKLMRLSERMGMIEFACRNSNDDETVQFLIFEAITKGIGYQTMNAKYVIPCSRDEYYNSLHKAYYLISYNLHTF